MRQVIDHYKIHSSVVASHILLHLNPLSINGDWKYASTLVSSREDWDLWHREGEDEGCFLGGGEGAHVEEFTSLLNVSVLIFEENV